MKNLTIDQRYKVIAGAGNVEDFTMLLEALITRVADVRVPLMRDKLGQEQADLRKAVIEVLTDALDTIKREVKNRNIKSPVDE